MDSKAVKEWAAEYRRINEIEREEVNARLATESIEQSIRSYFAMCQLACAFAGSTDVPPELQESREEYCIELADKWKRLAERLGDVQ